MCKIIVKCLGEFKFMVLYYYLIVELDMDNVILLRIVINSDLDVKILFNDMIVKVCVMVLWKYLRVNS